MAHSRVRATASVRLAKRGWPWLLGAAAVGYAARSYDWAAVLPVVARIPAGRFLALEIVLILGVFAACAWRWAVVTNLALRGEAALRVFMYTSVSVAIGQVTPLQLGEALKIRFARSNGLPIRRSTVSMIVERVVDLMVVFDLAGGGLLHRCGASLGWTGLAVLVPPAALLCLPVLIDRLKGRFTPLARLASFGGADRIIEPSRLALLIILTAVKWVAAALSWQVALSCVGCWIGLADCLLTIATVSVVTMLSMVPGGLGVQELSVAAMLTALGNPPDIAQAGSIAVRMVLPVMVLLGLAQLPGVVRAQPLPLGSGAEGRSS